MATYLRHKDSSLDYFLMHSDDFSIFVMINYSTNWIERKTGSIFFTKDYTKENFKRCKKEEFNEVFEKAMSNIKNSKL